MNPFDISFGKSPKESITRHTQFQTVIETFDADIPSNQIYMLTGVRGSGKNCPDGKISHINSFLNLKKDEINPYRKRLIRKGIVNGSEYGILKSTLPLFDEFVISNYTE